MMRNKKVTKHVKLESSRTYLLMFGTFCEKNCKMQYLPFLSLMARDKRRNQKETMYKCAYKGGHQSNKYM